MLKPSLFSWPQRGGLNAEQRRLLSLVSRSFDLSIRLLPAALQAPVAIGYLLARATDTVADTTALPLDERQVLLTLMSQAIDANQACTTRTAEQRRDRMPFGVPRPSRAAFGPKAGRCVMIAV
jgi:farnesyl-diphosphate farnesyltransferase